MRLQLAASLLLVLTTATGQAEPDPIIRRSTGVGQGRRVDSLAHWDSRCLPAADAVYTITKPPAHGRTEVRDEMKTAGKVRTGLDSCEGRQVKARALWYLPEAGYVGRDSFEYDSQYSVERRHAVVEMNVK